MGYRILFLMAPFPGHINSTLGVAKALVENGHEVIYYTSKPLSEDVKKVAGANALVKTI